MDAFVYNSVFLVRDGRPIVNIGGIETLINYLISVLIECGHRPVVFQCSDVEFCTEFHGATVYGVPFPAGTPIETIVADFRSRARNIAGGQDTLEIFAADHFSVPNSNPLAIAIQNGVWWDQPIGALTPKRIFHSRIGEVIFRLKKQFQMLHLFENSYNRVCADLNYINWYRTCRGSITGKVWFNPNPAPDTPWDPVRELRSADDPVRIIFARRLVPQKGTRLISEVFKELLNLRKNIRITIAGDGPEENYLRQVFAEESRVTITSYQVSDVIAVHKNHDISIIPSLLSEATCLAVAEGMAAGCAVIATNYGGMTNQIIDGYNGLLAWADKESLLLKLLLLCDHPEKRLLIQKRGWETSQSTFSLARWREQWRTILQEVVLNQPDAIADMATKRRNLL